MFGALKRLFPSRNDRYIKSLRPTVAAINAKEAEVAALDDAGLRARTDWLKGRLAAGETLDDILPDAFATVREAAKRTLGQRHFDVQLMGGMVLHNRKIAEMGTGEGKTLVATLPVYLNALAGKGVHVVTVNDYLANRDSNWMGQIYKFLGLTVGCIQQGMSDADRRAAYGSDVTYGTNSELGFDYLRDNMKYSVEDMVHRPFNFAIVDEVDSILIDEARTPLIISGPSQDRSDLYDRVDKIIPLFKPEHYEKDEKARSITFTDAGTEFAENTLREKGILTQGNLYDVHNVVLVHHMNQALRAHHLFTRDVDYIVREGRVHLIDEFTGRIMEGRRLSDGLHQAIEAKEGVTVQNENQTLATITYQNFFRMYPKLAGMTGTAMTEAEEFGTIYGLEVVDVPPNLPRIRKDEHDEVYRTAQEKYDAILKLIEECHARQQPVLVGTVSIEKSEVLADLLRKKSKIAPQVLNAKYHEQEAYIIAQAGVPGAVTIATNMAGRGTDIQLGGNADYRIAGEEARIRRPLSDAEKDEIRADVAAKKKVALEGGGLYVIGTERHESRRIDNQLRGRSGRQGDPGGSKFYLSLQDDLMRIFGSERMDGMLQKLGLKPGEAIIHPWINKAIEKAQKKVEARNFDIRKNLLQFDDVMNDQRRAIFEQRREVMLAEDIQQLAADMRHEVIGDLVARCMPEKAMPVEWDIATLHEETLRVLGLDLPFKDWAAEEGIADEEIRERMIAASDRKMAEKAANFGPDLMRRVEKSLTLQTIDQGWRDHLAQLDYLRHGVNLRAYGQKQPLLEYQREAFQLFQQMLGGLRERVTTILSRIEIRTEPPAEDLAPRRPMQFLGGGNGAAAPAAAATAPRPAPADTADRLPKRVAPDARNPGDPASWGKVARNEPCPCGSGKKYKHCHGDIGKTEALSA
ncbi:MAG: preprotein translocase subunit SecA [Rhodospirillaceae bacterium]|nr:preprotein translocase subunit SecA [Rhodospirillaceae bacterium]